MPESSGKPSETEQDAAYGPILAKLDELIAATRAGAIPLRDRWGDAATIGAVLGQEPRYVLARLACLPDFPRPLSDNVQPRWLIGEVQEWALEHRRKSTQIRKRKK